MTSIDLYVDPVCPFAWVTSRWLLDAAAATGRSVALRQMSLATLNEGTDVAPAHRARLEMSRRRAVCSPPRQTATDPAHSVITTKPLARAHTNGEEMTDSVIQEVRAGHQRSQDALGGKGGSPIIAVDDTALFGPVLIDLPAREAGVALLDAVLTTVSTPGFAVLQRPYQGPPSTGSAESR